MVAQERANRILLAWLAGSVERLKSELESAFSHLSASESTWTLEDEEQELLESVAADLWTCLARAHALSNERLQCHFALLRHLSQRSTVNPLKSSCAA